MRQIFSLLLHVLKFMTEVKYMTDVPNTEPFVRNW